MLVQKVVVFRLVAAKVQSGYQSNRHHLCIDYPTLAVLLTVKCFQDIVTKAKGCYNLAVHVISWLGCCLSSFNITNRVLC